MKIGAARCSSNNWYQSLKIRGGGGGSAGFMRGGGRGRKKEVVGGAMPLAAGRGVMPLAGEGRWRCDGARSPARCDAARRSQGVMHPRDDGGARRCCVSPAAV
jgi:hypothetical protein